MTPKRKAILREVVVFIMCSISVACLGWKQAVGIWLLLCACALQEKNK